MCRAVKTSDLPSTSLSVGQSGGLPMCRAVKTSGLPSTSLSVGQSAGSINVPGSKNIWLTEYILVCRSVSWVYQCAGQ